ncbi:hypothetical protein RIF29_16777 [Crotalaria pallida]|uniref:SGTA homodimerisation domain-containing protein n=1 Tax=Crotalaria pallida TaxID=3830 RepID=A0AAN9FFW6_CROPI
MPHNITTDSPLSRRIVRSFLHFLNSVELGAGVDAEGIEVAKDCLAEAFKLNNSSPQTQLDSLIDIFKSLDANKIQQCHHQTTTKTPSAAAAAAAAASSSSFQMAPDEDSIRSAHTTVSKDELCGQFFAALAKIDYFRTNVDGIDDPLRLEKASRLLNDAFMEMDKSGCQEFTLKNLAESLKSLGNKAMQSEQYPDAIELYNCAIALYEKSAVYFCNRAAAYTQIKRYMEAIQDCLKSIEIDPNYSKAYSRLGSAYYEQGKYREAIELGYRKALELDPTNESVRENIRLAEQRLMEQHNGYQNQSSRSGSNAVPPPFSFTSPPYIPNDLAAMFMNMASNSEDGSEEGHFHEGEDTDGADVPEIIIGFGDNPSVNVEHLPDHISGAFRSVVEYFENQSSGQPQDQMNGSSAPN